jgi:hypothetical protein
MEQKRRGRPPGPKKEIKMELNTTTTTEPKKRGRKAVEKPKKHKIPPQWDKENCNSVRNLNYSNRTFR